MVRRSRPIKPTYNRQPNYPDQPTREKTGLGAKPQHINQTNQTTPPRQKLPVAQSPHTYLGGPWAFYAWGLPKSLCAQSDKNATANQLPRPTNSRKNGAWGKAPTYKANQSNQFVTFEKLAKSPKFAKVTFKTSTANKARNTKQTPKRSSKKRSSKKGANQPNPYQI